MTYRSLINMPANISHCLILERKYLFSWEIGEESLGVQNQAIFFVFKANN